MHHLIFGINFQIHHLISLVSPVSVHLVIHLSTHPCHYYPIHRIFQQNEVR